MKILTILMLLTALTTLTACDRLAQADFRGEHDDRLYRAAMDDYRSGRLDAALSGFEKAIRADPANASARFQLACLLQDAKRDFVGAYCGYREYLMQEPTSDKAKLAKDRLATCEREVAKVLSERYSVGVASAAASAEVDALKGELKEMRARLEATEKSLAEAQAKAKTLAEEKNRLLFAMKNDDDADDKAQPVELKDVRAILDAEDEESLAPQPFVTTVKNEKPEEKEHKSTEQKAPAVPTHPATYMVEDGDTLYGISKRFYGTMSAWKKIRDANKALISADNRLSAGDTLVLPEL